MPDPVKKKKKVQKKPSNMQGRGGGATKNTAIKGTRANTEKASKKRKKEQEWYGPQNRIGIAPKKKKRQTIRKRKDEKKGPKLKGGGKVLTSGSAKSVAALRKAGLVSTRRKSQNIYYSMNGDASGRVINVLKEIYCPI